MSVGPLPLASATVAAPAPVQVTVGVHAGIARRRRRPTSTRSPRVLRDFGGRFGPYPWPAYTLAITPGLSGGIEYPMHVMQGPGTIGRTTSHEVGHSGSTAWSATTRAATRGSTRAWRPTPRPGSRTR